MMRINHLGEICAQALYRGQAFVCGSYKIRNIFLKAALEETDHLIWCSHRIKNINSRISIINPIFYIISFILGIFSGSFGTSYNLGFMSETEKQVEDHLNKHLLKLPFSDIYSRRIIEIMKEDEIKHQKTAKNSGMKEISLKAKIIMKITSKIMIFIAFYI